MEIHRELPTGIESYKPSFDEGPDEYFKKAIEFGNKFYSDEIKRISSVKLESVTEEFFFREVIWVIHATGFSAKAVGSFMPKLLEAYGNWDVCGKDSFDLVMERVKLVCNNPQKAKAVHSISKRMISELSSMSWDDWKTLNISDIDKLEKLPYIGKITRYHLGRNIGLLDCVKPDLHLVRMAEYWGFSDCESMCKSMRTDDTMPLGIVDLILWFTISTFGSLSIRKQGHR